MDVVWRQAILALGLGLNVIAVGMLRQAVAVFIKIGAAIRKNDIVDMRRIFDNVEHRSLARRRRPKEIACAGGQAIKRARTPRMHELFVIMKIEAVEIHTLPTFDLLDPDNLSF